MTKPFLLSSNYSRDLLNDCGIHLESLDNFGADTLTVSEIENFSNALIERVVYIFQDETNATAEDVKKVFKAIKSEFGV